MVPPLSEMWTVRARPDKPWGRHRPSYIHHRKADACCASGKSRKLSEKLRRCLARTLDSPGTEFWPDMKSVCRPACKPGSVPVPEYQNGDDHLSSRPVA